MSLHTTIFVPADVPVAKQDLFIKNYTMLTHNTNRFFLFSCDQKMEHLNYDFYGHSIHPHALHPEHMFRIASGGKIGAMATHLGLIARYGKQYPTIPYIVKLNGKTNLITAEQDDPMSALLWNIDDVVCMKQENNLSIAGIGITIYLGSDYEAELLAQAAQSIYQAHREGLVAIVWAYCAAKAIERAEYVSLIAGAAGVAHSLGADFVKIKMSDPSQTLVQFQYLALASAAAGNTKLLCAGGPRVAVSQLLTTIYDQIHNGNASGVAIGRNIFQHSLPEAIALTHAVWDIVYDNSDSKSSFTRYQQEVAIKQ